MTVREGFGGFWCLFLLFTYSLQNILKTKA